MTVEAVRYAGVDLRTLGCTFDVIDGATASPPIRGQNLLIPYQHGRRPLTKFYDEKVIVLGGTIWSGVSRQDWQAKLDVVKALFPIGAGEQKLEIQRQDGSFRYVMAEVRNTLGLESPLPPWKWSAFSIELSASDPFWYGSTLECATPRLPWYLDGGSLGPQLQGLLGLTLLDAANLYTGSLVRLDDAAHWLNQTSAFFMQFLGTSPASVEATNSGDYPTRKPVFSLIGSMVNPIFKNLRNGLSFQINRTIADGLPVVIDCGAQLVTISGAPQFGAVTPGTGQTDWMRLEPGENTLVITGVSAAGTYQAQYSPAFL